MDALNRLPAVDGADARHAGHGVDPANKQDAVPVGRAANAADAAEPSGQPARRIEARGTPEARWQAWPDLRECPVIALDELVPPGARAVVVAPHPDDEVLACGGLLALRARGRLPSLVVGVTDGEASHAGCDGWRPAELARRRRRERALGLARLGGVSSIELALPDGEVRAHADLLAHRLGDLLDPTDVVFVTSRVDGHPDHEACARAVIDLATARRCRVVEMPVWLWHWAEPAQADVAWAHLRRLPLTAHARRCKRAAIEAHASQFEPMLGREAIVAPWALERLTRPFEYFFVEAAHDAR